MNVSRTRGGDCIPPQGLLLVAGSLHRREKFSMRPGPAYYSSLTLGSRCQVGVGQRGHFFTGTFLVGVQS